MNFLKTTIFALVVGLILFVSVRGIEGNPNSKDVNTPKWKENGPFELSPERGRFALLYSLIEDNSFFFSVDLARFTTPDLGFKNGNYVSLFAPAVSYIASVGYLIGKYFGLSQVGSFLTISLFALLNGLLIRAISLKFGASKSASNLGAIIYLFATPAFAYSVTLYQHQISTFLILATLYLLSTKPSFFKLFIIWTLCAASIPVDYPNLFLMAPIGLYALRWIVVSKPEDGRVQFNIKIPYLLSFVGLALPLIFFFWFNYHSYGNPLQFSGTVGSVAQIDQDGKPTTSRTVKLDEADDYVNPQKQKKSAVGFFDTRDISSGLYIHLLSPDRGIINFTPIIILGLFGLFVAYKKKIDLAKVLVSVIGMNILLYSMWGDPWGGWAFGSRYLIPSYSLFSIFLALLLTKYKKNFFVLILFLIISGYSVSVNGAGALSTSANPPKVQVLELEKVSGTVEKYTYERNTDFLKSGKSKSFVYNTYFKDKVTAYQYYQIIIFFISTLLLVETLSLILNKKDNDN